MFEEYLLEWTVSNVLVVVLLFLCWKHPKYGRFGFGVIFLIASIVNTLTVLYSPKVYLEYRQFVILDIYGTFIEGFFSLHIVKFVLSIALGQFLISAGLLYGRHLLKPALLGAMLFSLAIIPLGVGSGMPAPVIMALALWLLFAKKESKNPSSIVT